MMIDTEKSATEGTGSTQNSGVTARCGNLRPFPPGQSGNPGGRPKKLPVTDYLRSQLEENVPAAMLDRLKPLDRALVASVLGETPTFGQFVAFRAIERAIKGDVLALREVLDRVEGKVTKPVSLSGEGGDGLVLRVIRVGADGI